MQVQNKRNRTFRIADETAEKLEAVAAWVGLTSRTAALEYLAHQAWKSIPPHALPVPKEKADDKADG